MNRLDTAVLLAVKRLNGDATDENVIGFVQKRMRARNQAAPIGTSLRILKTKKYIQEVWDDVPTGITRKMVTTKKYQILPRGELKIKGVR